MKRFYTSVSVGDGEDGYRILLDGKPIRTPGKTFLALPSRALAEAVAEEWAGQGEVVAPATMHLTKLANTAIDRVAGRRDDVIEQILNFGRSDLICYRAAESAGLASRQADAWDQILEWIRKAHGAELVVTTGLVHVEQPDEAIAALRRSLETRHDFALAPLYAIASITGSLVLALSLADHHIGTTATFAFSRIDEVWQAEKWGSDSEAEARAGALFAELQSAQIFLDLIAA